ncbi:dienelactone hydrolase family protein [Saccharata proteae CBS 121410]|uniref:Dienelactone hydrolase family protein n=1 Tax=Saccharata proteae CBS 121410 TaxID=1314787 RepID=A0A9P4LXR0_9PEZI|nr:dienelactone hydrolase family protein [Saccharata proteae CBS 121410]
MADRDIATRAPEGDAQEIAEEPSHAPSMSAPKEHCTSDRPAPSGEVPTGETTKLNGVDVYIAKPSDYPHSPSKLLLLLTGGTGIQSTNNQLQADKFAKEGFLVIMPDQFGNDPAPNATFPPRTEHSSVIDQVKTGIAEFAKSALIDRWLAYHTPERVLPILHKVIEGVREEFADAIANGGGIYGVGYCFGARYILLLGGKHPDTVAWGQASSTEDVEAGVAEKGPEIKVGAIAHATMATKEELAAVVVPVTLVCAENDPLFPEETVTAGVQSLQKNSVEHEIKTYPNVPHGFAVVGDYPDDPKIMEQQKLAYEQMLNWLKTH